jgi:hypothetical protein
MSGIGWADVVTILYIIVLSVWTNNSLYEYAQPRRMKLAKPHRKSFVGKLWVGFTETSRFERIQAHSLMAATRNKC